MCFRGAWGLTDRILPGEKKSWKERWLRAEGKVPLYVALGATG